MLAVIDFLLMITSSSYGINTVIKAKKDGKVSTMFMVLHIIMHLFFVWDVLSSIIVFVKIKKCEKKDGELSSGYGLDE